MDLKDKIGGLYFGVEEDKHEWLLAPPIVEVSKIDGNIPVLVDGEHRFVLAREYGQKVRVVWIEGVSEEIPVIAKPIKWDEVKIYDVVPELAGKRDFRFRNLKDIPRSKTIKEKVTKENMFYFYYRDLSKVCSSGIRKVGS